MIHTPDTTGLALILGLIALAITPLIVQQHARWKMRRLVPPRAWIDSELMSSTHWSPIGEPKDDWEGIDRARAKPGAPRPGPRPYDWQLRVPATLLEPGRRPRSGRC